MTLDRVVAPSMALLVASLLAGLAACSDPSGTQPRPPDGATAEPDQKHGPAGGAGDAPSAPQGGMKAYVDPETGELLDTPPPGAEPLPGDVITPPPDAKPRPAPGGGELLDTAPSPKGEPEGGE